MDNTEKACFVCDSYKELQLLKNKYEFPHMILTVNHQFYQELQKERNSVIFFKESNIIPFEKAWEIIDKINDILTAFFADSRKTDFLRLFLLTNNIIEDNFGVKIISIINNLDTIKKLTEEFKIGSFYVCDNKYNWVLNESIYLYARYHKIPCRIFENENEKEILKTLEMMCHREVCEQRLFFEEHREVEKIKKQNKINWKSARECKESHWEIGVLYCCEHSYPKHVNWTLNTANNIVGDIKIISYYNNREDMEQFEKNNYVTDCMEDYFSLKEFLEDYENLYEARYNFLELLRLKLKIEYFDIDLSEYIVIKLANYYFRTMGKRLYMDVCTRKYFQYHSFKFIRAWGDSNYWETRICYYYTRKYNTRIFKIDEKPFMINAYKHLDPDMCALIMDCKAGIHLNDQVSNGLLNRKSIAVLPTGLARGVTTEYFYYNVFMRIIEILLEKGFEIFFKNHPCLEDLWEQDVYAKFHENPLFHFCDNMISIFDVLEQCDSIITDLSYSAIEAAVDGKAVFCIVDENGYRRISHHKEGFYITRDVEEIIKTIELVLREEDAYIEVINRQNQYLKEVFFANTNIGIREQLDMI